MRLARAHMPSLAQNPALADDDATDSRIRIRREKAARGERQRARHVRLPGLWAGPGHLPSSPSPSPGSSGSWFLLGSRRRRWRRN